MHLFFHKYTVYSTSVTVAVKHAHSCVQDNYNVKPKL